VKEKIIFIIKKIVNYYYSLVQFVNNSLKEDISKTLVMLLILIILFLFFDSSLAAILFASALAVLIFRWESRIFFGLALIFLIFCPVFLIADSESHAENMAIYAYYLLVVGVVVQIIEYIREQRQIIPEARRDFKINWSVTFILVMLMIIGFAYLRHTFTTKLAEQDKLINRIGGYAVQEEDAETKKMKEQLQGILEMLTSASYNRDSQVQGLMVEAPTGTTIQLEPKINILNGSHISGAAAKLRDELQAKGFTISSVGNAEGYFTETVIRYRNGWLDKAKQIQLELGQYRAKLEETQDIDDDLLIIIGPSK